MFAAILICEEILDTLQREAMTHERVQPLVRLVSRIHVVEEARHVRYAREELVRIMPRLNKGQLARQRVVVAVVSYLLADALIDPKVYESVGIAPEVGRAAALANPHHQQTRRWMAEKVMPFLTELGIVGGPSKRLYRKSFLI